MKIVYFLNTHIFLITVKPCGQITVPHRGFVNCSEEKPVRHCSVGCTEGYGFSSKYQTLLKGSIECDGTDGLWDYQRDQNTTKLPECLGKSVILLDMMDVIEDCLLISLFFSMLSFKEFYF